MARPAEKVRVAADAAASTARRYARRLLDSLGLAGRPLDVADEHPAVAWASSGLMELTGHRDGAPQMCPSPIAACADGALAALASLAPDNGLARLRGARLLAERAAIAGWSRAGAASPSGSCRLLEAADGWLALNVPRDEDWRLMPAWLERDGVHWDGVGRMVRERSATELVERGRLIGLAVAPEAPSPGRTPGVGWVERSETQHAGLRSAQPSLQAGFRQHDGKAPIVVDLSSLWAGPLCTHLLQLCGARVLKVESIQRPDGARYGATAFFDLLNAGKASVALDFGSARGRGQLRALLAAADIVIEGSRPRALRQLGLDAEQLVAENPRQTWISITGYGRSPETENWIAYGDDAGVAAGLSHLMYQATGDRLMVGDALADPLTGIHAALAAWAGFRGGGAGLVPAALAEVVARSLAFDAPVSAGQARERTRAWAALAPEAARPVARRPAGAARPLGADTAAVLAQFGIPA